MSEWKTVRLGDYITEYSVKNKSNEDIPVYSVTNTQGFCTEYFSKDVSSKDKSNYKIVPRGCFAYNPSRINVGSVDWQRYEDRVIVSPLYNVFKVSPELENQYLYYFLKSDIGHTLITSKAEGSVRDNLKITMLAEFSIPLPPLEEQKHIAAMLDKCTALVTKYKLMLEKYDTLIKSRFIEMFGDLATNPKKWIIKNFTECAIIDTKMVKDFEKYADYPHIGIDSIEKETGILSGYRTIKEDNVISGKYLFTPEHIIYSKIRPNLNKVAMPNFNGLCSADAYPILVKNNITTREYLAYVMRSDFYVSYILAFSRRANMPKVNKEQVESFNLPLPPYELQKQFSSFVQQIDKSKFAVQKSLEKTETLYKSLMQRYFA